MRQEEVGARYMEQLINNPKAFIKEMQGKSGVIDDLTAFFKGYNKYSKNLPKSEKKAINKVYNEFLDAMKETATEKEGVENYSFGRGRGYHGYSMSNNAVSAYDDGEMPLSKWTKAAILENVADIDDTKVDLVKKLPLSVLKAKLLRHSSWHHTSKYYNSTDFYSIRNDVVEELDEKTVQEWLANKDEYTAKKEATEPTIRKGKIHYLEWGGTRKHPKATDVVLDDVNIEERGSFYIITDDQGREILRKKIGSNGTWVSYKDDQTMYSLPDTDSEGRKLTEAQREFFADSKVVDDRGELQVVYHGTMSGAFTVFDASYSNVESDMGAGFYFSSTYDDVAQNYEKGGQDFENKISRLAERIESEEDVDYEEAKEIARKRLEKGSNLFEVYLNIKNPAYVGGEYDTPTTLFEDFFDYSDINEEDFDSEDDYWEARAQYEDEAIDEFAYKVNSILDAEGIDNYEDYLIALQENGVFEGVTVNQLKDIINESVLDASDQKGNYASNEVARAIIEALGYDGIIDNTVVDKFGYNSGRYSYMEGIEDDTRHYIAFYPEQIKLVDNETPTADKDIRFSLSEKGIDKYTTAQYNNFGWVRANDVLTARQWHDFNHKYNEIKFQKHGEVHKSSSGEYIVAVNDMIGDSFGVNNVLVFVKGSPDNPKVTQVIKINSNNETELDSIRREIYDFKGVPRFYVEDGIIERYEANAFPQWAMDGKVKSYSGRNIKELQNGRGYAKGPGQETGDFIERGSDSGTAVRNNNIESGDTLFSLPETDYENVLAHVERFKSIKAINEYFDKKIDELDEYKNDREKYMSEVEKIAEKEKAV